MFELNLKMQAFKSLELYNFANLKFYYTLH